MDQRGAWIALASVEGIGATTFGLLLAAFGEPPEVFRATLDGRLDRWLSEWRAAEGRPVMARAALEELHKMAADPERAFDGIKRLGLWTLTPMDPDYPSGLRDLVNPPAVIFGSGNRDALESARVVGVVGTRRPTLAGRALATRICARLVECSATVISGVAVGIDGAAHAATIERGGTTVGVIGGGHLHPGPLAHGRLRDEIVARGGALISEYHPTTQPTRGTYPRRNRIIAALSHAVLVIEAPRTSGALITARHALELGRPVFVAPGRIGDWSTAGSLALLRDSPARPIVGLDELVEDLGYFDPPAAIVAGGDGPRSGSREPALAMLGPTEQIVARRLSQGPAGLDLLVNDTGLGPGVVSSAVTLLLMRGWAQSVGPAYMTAGPLAE